MQATQRGRIMGSNFLFIVTIAAILSVLAILILGVAGFAKGGAFNRKYSNKLMQARIVAQAIAVALIVLLVWLRSTGG